MAEKTLDTYEIDISKIVDILKRFYILFFALIVLGGAAAFTVTQLFIPKTYTATSTVIVVPSGTEETSLTYNDLQISQKLLETYSRIIKSEAVGDQVIRNLSLENRGLDFESYKRIISTSTPEDSEILDVTAVTNDPVLSANIANEAVRVFENKVYQIMNINNVTVLDTAKAPARHSGPSAMKNTLVGIACGLLISILIIAAVYMTDHKVKTEEDVKAILGYPIIGSIPEYTPSKPGRSKAYGR